jgi:pimeloyl-ACP methyl ester carboxylesterase
VQFTTNPSFPLSREDARDLLKQMRRQPRPLERPVVVAGGIHDPGFVNGHIAGILRSVTCGDGDRVISVAFFGPGTGTFDGCRERLIAAVRQGLSDSAPGRTAEVDVVAYSMGGLVARHAARPRPDGPALAVRRLFTIASPHRGARMAGLPTWDRRAMDMRPGSPFLAALDEDLAAADYQLVAYARLGDAVVGAENSSPPGVAALWVSNPPFSAAHLGAGHDPRILADIARRLRGEPPLQIGPPAPLPRPATPGQVGSEGPLPRGE